MHPVVEGIVNNFYSKSGINRDDFHRQGKTNIRTDFDFYTLPFKLINEERKVKSNLLTIVSRPLDTDAQILRFPPASLEAVLYLEPPKRVIQYVPVSTPSTYVEPKAKVVKAKLTRGPRQPKTLKRNAPEVASIYADEESERQKRSKLNDDEDDEVDVYPSDTEEVVVHHQATYKKTPNNFYEVANHLFDYFWGLEFDNNEVTAAFFGRITAINCRDFGLTNFADTCSSLAAIKDKLKGNQYFSVEDFVYDFNQMFSNIFKYYADTHPAYKKAQELLLIFETKMEEANQRFR